MANKDHETRAGYAVDVWNRWRDENPQLVPDLSGANLSKGLHRKRKLFGANLRGADFRRSNMRGADLHESDLEKADLSKTDLREANLREANLKGVELQKANLIGADLTEADLSGADLEKAQVEKSNLARATLAGTRLRKTDLAGVLGLTQEQIDEAEGDRTTKLPDGLVRPSGWKERKQERTPDPEQ